MIVGSRLDKKKKTEVKHKRKPGSQVQEAQKSIKAKREVKFKKKKN